MTISRRRVLFVALLLAAVGIAIWQVMTRINVSASPGSAKTQPAGQDRQVSAPTSPSGALLSGTVHAPDCENVRVYLALYTVERALLSRVELPVTNGTFFVASNQVPGLRASVAGTLTVEARGCIPESTNIAILQSSQSTSVDRIEPSSIYFRLAQANRWLIFLVFLPALWGLSQALLHWTGLWRGVVFTRLYALGVAAAWIVVMAVIVFLYATDEAALIPAFWPNLWIPVGIVAFAFLGTLVYVAFSLEDKTRDVLFNGTEQQKQAVLIALGGRVLIAPYVAMVGYTLFATTFASLNTPAFAAFFGFFTGVWIKPVLQALNDIGTRFLSVEEQLKIHARLTAATATETQSAASQPPTSAFAHAAEEAREQLLKIEGVLGVAPGSRMRDGIDTNEPAIVVYVADKRDLPESDPDRIPAVIHGYRTDVRNVPDPPAEGCFKEGLALSPGKIAALATAARKTTALTSALPRTGLMATVAADVWLIVDEDGTLFWESPRNQRFFDAMTAFSVAQQTVGDGHEFMAFVVDFDSGFQGVGNYCERVLSEDVTLGYTWNERTAWGTSQLIAAQVHTFVPYLRTALHEIVHAWAAYIDIPPCGANPARVIAPDHFHWMDFIDYGNSCMNESGQIWTPAAGGMTRTGFHPNTNSFGLCDLDLLLMGLLRRDEITKPIAILNPIAQNGVHPFTGDEIAPVCLPNRTPRPAGSRAFRQAFVVISKNEASGRAMAADLSLRLGQYEANFNRACRSLATLNISRAR